MNDPQRWAQWGSDHELVMVFPRPGCGYVYVAWGADRTRPLYVGKAVTPSERILRHLREKSWAKDVETWEVHGFPSEWAAELAETEAIHDFNPIHNVTRRLTQAQWNEVHRRFAAEQLRKAEARQQIVADFQERQAARARKVLPEPIVSPHPRRRLRRVQWRDDLFTPDQMAIIARVQNRGRAA